MQCYTGHELVPTNTDWSNIEGITGRKDRGPQVAGGNKLQAADGFFLLYTHTHTHTLPEEQVTAIEEFQFF